MEKAPVPEPARYQIWADKHPCSQGRLVRVNGADVRYVYVTVIQKAEGATERSLGRQHRVLRSNFVRGYRYVREDYS